MNKPVVCLMGPTATGKSALAMALTHYFPFELVSVDSALVYRGLDIGTAKPTLAERTQYPHALIDCCEPTDIYSAGQFCSDAEQCIEKIHAAGKIPLLVGGTMMFFSALQKGFGELPIAVSPVREQINQEAAQVGWRALHAQLAQIDPQAAQRIHRNDTRRIQRALEIYYLTGRSKTETIATTPASVSQRHYLNVMLVPPDRTQHQIIIATRLEAMLAAGLVDEVAQLKRRPEIHADLPCMRAVGYRQVWNFLAGGSDEAQMKTQVMIATRQLAKRQMTWLTQFPGGVCFAYNDAHLIESVRVYLEERLYNTAPRALVSFSHRILPSSCHVLQSKKLDGRRVHLRFSSIRTSQSNGKLRVISSQVPGAQYMGTKPFSVLVTRPQQQALVLCEQLHAAGFTPISFPTIEIVRGYTDAELVRRIDVAASCTKTIFTSQNAVHATAAVIRQRWNLAQMQVYAVGDETAKALEQYDIPVHGVPGLRAGSEALLACPGLRAIEGELLALITGRHGREYLVDELIRRGAQLQRLDVYVRQRPSHYEAMAWQQWQRDQLEVIVVGSQETLMNLRQMVDVSGQQFLRRCILVTLSQRIADYARKNGFVGPIYIAEAASNTGIVRCLRNIRNIIEGQNNE
jgi:tRNA dimethylallyltransferase